MEEKKKRKEKNIKRSLRKQEKERIGWIWGGDEYVKKGKRGKEKRKRE